MDRASLYNEAYGAQQALPSGALAESVLRDSKRMLLWAQEARDRFLSARDWRGLRVLECGGGLGGVSLQLAELGAQCSIADISSRALLMARDLAHMRGVELQTFEMDLGRPPERALGQYDLIIDSHLLHCLPLVPERASFLQLVKDHLAPGGILVGETMAFRKKLFLPDGVRLDDEKVLWQHLGAWVPVRKIADSMDIEAEFAGAGFRIVCFMYYANYGIAPTGNAGDLPADVLPAAVRYVLTRAA